MATAPNTAFDAISLTDLTSGTVGGNAVFDILMKTAKEHLDHEFQKNRIKGPEYSTVYLGSLQTVLSTSVQFLMAMKSANQDSLLKEKQLELADLQIQKAQAELVQIQAQTDLLVQQKVNLDAQKTLIDNQSDQVIQQTTNLAAQKLQIDAEKELTIQKTANAVIEGTVLTSTKCKLDAEYDVLMLTKDKTTAETQLLQQKTTTEKAQVLALGVDDNSVIGRQKALYAAQTDGFAKDAIQKAAKIMMDTWSVRRTTDTETSANSTNKLDDATVGRAVEKLLASVGA